MVAAEPEAEALLWRYLLDIDLTEALEISSAPLDDPLAWRLADWRAYRVTGQADFLWVRVLDPVAALSARTYGSTDQLVLDVADRFRPQTAGTYRIDGVSRRTAARSTGPGGDARPGGRHRRSGRALPGRRVGDRVGAGRARSRRGAPRWRLRADRFFAAERPPYCLTRF